MRKTVYCSRMASPVPARRTPCRGRQQRVDSYREPLTSSLTLSKSFRSVESEVGLSPSLMVYTGCKLFFETIIRVKESFRS